MYISSLKLYQTAMHKERDNRQTCKNELERGNRSRIPPKHMKKGKEKELRITSQVVIRSGNTQIKKTSGIHGPSHEICLISKKPCEPGNPRIGYTKDRTPQRTPTCQWR